MTWWNRPEYKSREGIICDGAIRSGKTMAAACGFFLWSMSAFDGGVFGLCGKTVGSFRRNVLLPLSGWLGQEFRVKEHRAENKLTVSLGSRVNTYYIFGGQDESAYTLVQGITLWGVFLDEAVLMPRSFVQQVCARCSVAGSKLWFTCNPGSPEHWFYKELVQPAEQKGLLRLHFTMDDNPSLPPAVKKRYETLYSGVFYSRYVQGMWCAAEGLVYDFDKKSHCFDTPPREGRYYISVDYGTQNPFSAGLWRVDKGIAYRLGEFYHNGREQGMLTDEEYYDALLTLAEEKPVEAVIIDPSAASFIALLRRKGRFRVRRADNRVQPGLRLVGSLLKAGRLKISPDCADCIREFGLYSYEPGQDAPKKEFDHALDEVRYFCMTVMRRAMDN